MRTIGVIGAMDMEIIYIRDAMEIEEHVQYAGFDFYVGRYRGLKIVVVVCGKGKVYASCCSQILIIKFNITHIINFGIATSVREDVRICDIVIAHGVMYHEVAKRSIKTISSHKKIFKVDEFLLNKSIEAFSNIELKECNYHLGLVVTDNGFIQKSNVNNYYYEDCEACCIDIEGAAVAHVAYLNRIPSILVKGISDGFKQWNFQFDNELNHVAAYNAAKFTLRVLDNIKC